MTDNTFLLIKTNEALAGKINKATSILNGVLLYHKLEVNTKEAIINLIKELNV